MDMEKRAREIHMTGCNCAQAVACAYAEKFGWDKDLVLKLTAGLGLGFGGSGEICGAIVGACMVLSEKIADMPKGERYAAIKKFVSEFNEKYGATKCPDLKNPEINGQRYNCNDLVGGAAAILEKYV